VSFVTRPGEASEEEWQWQCGRVAEWPSGRNGGGGGRICKCKATEARSDPRTRVGLCKRGATLLHEQRPRAGSALLATHTPLRPSEPSERAAVHCKTPQAPRLTKGRAHRVCGWVGEPAPKKPDQTRRDQQAATWDGTKAPTCA
jgi:hypothetical protein